VDASAQTRTFGINAGDIGDLDRWVAAVGARWGAGERTVFAARLCIAELAANVLEHGVATAGADRITVTLRRCGDGIAIQFADSRAPFDPTREVAATPAADLKSLAPRGRGLRLLHAYADDLAYRNDGTCNRVTMTVR
jgi:serine/threonine-protein kinase RsbW